MMNETKQTEMRMTYDQSNDLVESLKALIEKSARLQGTLSPDDTSGHYCLGYMMGTLAWLARGNPKVVKDIQKQIDFLKDKIADMA